MEDMLVAGTLLSIVNEGGGRWQDHRLSILITALPNFATSTGNRQRFSHDFDLGKLLDFSASQLAQYIAQQRPVSAADLLKLHAPAQIFHQILHLRLEHDADVEPVQHQTEIRAWAQEFRGRDARAIFRNLLQFT